MVPFFFLPASPGIAQDPEMPEIPLLNLRSKIPIPETIAIPD
jgi:hypothetical protein